MKTAARPRAASANPPAAAAVFAASTIEPMAVAEPSRTLAGPPWPSPTRRPAASRIRARQWVPPPSTPTYKVPSIGRRPSLELSFYNATSAFKREVVLCLTPKDNTSIIPVRVGKAGKQPQMASGTETWTPRYRGLDTWSDQAILDAFWEGQARAIASMRPALPSIAAAANGLAERLNNGGRLI